MIVDPDRYSWWASHGFVPTQTSAGDLHGHVSAEAKRDPSDPPRKEPRRVGFVLVAPPEVEALFTRRYAAGWGVYRGDELVLVVGRESALRDIAPRTTNAVQRAADDPPWRAEPFRVTFEGDASLPQAPDRYRFRD